MRQYDYCVRAWYLHGNPARGYEWLENQHNQTNNALTYDWLHLQIQPGNASIYPKYKVKSIFCIVKILNPEEKRMIVKRGRRRISWIFLGFKKDQCVQNPKIGPERGSRISRGKFHIRIIFRRRHIFLPRKYILICLLLPKDYTLEFDIRR